MGPHPHRIDRQSINEINPFQFSSYVTICAKHLTCVSGLGETVLRICTTDVLQILLNTKSYILCRQYSPRNYFQGTRSVGSITKWCPKAHSGTLEWYLSEVNYNKYWQFKDNGPRGSLSQWRTGSTSMGPAFVWGNSPWLCLPWWIEKKGFILPCGSCLPAAAMGPAHFTPCLAFVREGSRVVSVSLGPHPELRAQGSIIITKTVHRATKHILMSNVTLFQCL